MVTRLFGCGALGRGARLLGKEAAMGSLVRSVVTGGSAGAAGTLAMDLLWYARYRRAGGTEGFVAWETAAGTTSYEGASPPAQVGKRLAEALTGSPPPDGSARLMTNAVHWGTGKQWGVVYGLARPVLGRRGPLVGGVALGLGAFAASYTLLPLLGVYRPLWEYDARTIGQDLSAHLLYGVTTAAAAAALNR
jgi:hypothetical protein